MGGGSISGWLLGSLGSMSGGISGSIVGISGSPPVGSKGSGTKSGSGAGSFSPGSGMFTSGLREIEQEKLKPAFSKEKQEARIINCRISKGKLTTQLDDGREISILVDLLTKKRILGENVKPEQLKNPELHNEGRYIYFPEIDEILPA
ncbi:1239_t:CDS:2 [Entrophospora sp. SA101]|nr:1239_t:CDS:2 [Entrophospora sp. SA101]